MVLTSRQEHEANNDARYAVVISSWEKSIFRKRRYLGYMCTISTFDLRVKTVVNALTVWGDRTIPELEQLKIAVQCSLNGDLSGSGDLRLELSASPLTTIG